MFDAIEPLQEERENQLSQKSLDSIYALNYPASGESKATESEKPENKTTPSDRPLSGTESHIQVDGIDRQYYVHLPKDYDASKSYPVIMAFHGAGGKASYNNEMTRLNGLSDKENVIVVYPQGLNGRWNDGRVIDGKRGPNDVAFASQVIDQIKLDYPSVDKGRIYAVGFSNGGFFAQRLAMEKPEKIAAVTSISATMTKELAEQKQPTIPVPVLYIVGDEDRVVPIEGGDITVNNKKTGEVISAEEAIQKWIQTNGIGNSNNVRVVETDRNPDDGTTIITRHFKGATSQREVVQMRVQGGGHAYPSADARYQIDKFQGKTTQEIANEDIWDFLKTRRRAIFGSVNSFV